MGCLFSSNEYDEDNENINLNIYEDSAFYSSETEEDTQEFRVIVEDDDNSFS